MVNIDIQIIFKISFNFQDTSFDPGIFMVIEEEVAKEDMDPLIPFPDNQDENS